MNLPTTRSNTGLALLTLGTLFTLLGMLVLGGVVGATALVLAVVLLTTGTLLYGTSAELPGHTRV